MPEAMRNFENYFLPMLSEEKKWQERVFSIFIGDCNLALKCLCIYMCVSVSVSVSVSVCVCVSVCVSVCA